MPRSTNQAKLQLWKHVSSNTSKAQQSIQQFCLSLGCTRTTFHYWQRKLEAHSEAKSSHEPCYVVCLLACCPSRQ